MDYNQELLFTPEGVRDIYGDEYAQRSAIQNTLQDVLRCYGFHGIKTPTFEFFDIFNREKGTASSNEMYKFFDRYNNTLVLRPDITPSIARSVAKYYKDEELQIRLCYTGDTFYNNPHNQGRLKEVTQVGAELLNDDTSDADGEMIAMTIECLQKAGLEEFQVDIGHAEFLQGVIEEAGLSAEEAVQVRTLLGNKNRYGLEELLAAKEIAKPLKELFVSLPELFGDETIFAYAKEHVSNERSLKAIERLENLHKILEVYGFSQYAIFDLGLQNQYGYYTGIIFKAYTYGSGEAIASGGRYDRLIHQFGKDAKAIGVAFLLDQLMTALNRQKITVDIEKNDVIVVYRSMNRRMAMDLAKEYREKGYSVSLMRKEAHLNLDDYKTYANRYGVRKVVFIQDNKEITEID